MDQLLGEYGQLFRDMDDLTLARWMSQTLGQFAGRVLRLSHPLVAAYRLAAQLGNERMIWQKRLVSVPMRYPSAACCGAPLLPLLTRDVLESGLVCLHCNETAIPFDELPRGARSVLRPWAAEYAQTHAVAHWDEQRQRACGNYDDAFNEAANTAIMLLAFLGSGTAPRLAETLPALIWEDQDECLEVRPEDIQL